MFYQPQRGHGLPHDPFNAIVAPRPIGWISTRGVLGDNLAPYSFFNAVAYTPPQVIFASTGAKPGRDGTKDTMAQVRESGVFCVNLASDALRHAMNDSAAALAAGVDEFQALGLERAACEVIDCPRVALAPAALECRLVQVVALRGSANLLAIGEVVGVHLRDEFLVEGRFDLARVRPLARLGYRDFAVIETLFEMPRPGEGQARSDGLPGIRS